MRNGDYHDSIAALANWQISEDIWTEGNRDNALQPREGEPGAITLDQVVKRANRQDTRGDRPCG